MTGIRKAHPDEKGKALRIIEEGRAFQLSYGNEQWADGYPSPALIEDDINKGIGYVLVIDDEIAAYLAIVDHDDSYDEIDGKWLSDGSYIALHRIAFSDSFRGKGLFRILIDETRKLAAEREAASIRIDTDRRNPIMLHLLPKLGFMHTGYILFDGDRKLAYERLIDQCRNQ